MQRVRLDVSSILQALEALTVAAAPQKFRLSTVPEFRRGPVPPLSLALESAMVRAQECSCELG